MSAAGVRSHGDKLKFALACRLVRFMFRERSEYRMDDAGLSDFIAEDERAHTIWEIACGVWYKGRDPCEYKTPRLYVLCFDDDMADEMLMSLVVTIGE